MLMAAETSAEKKSGGRQKRSLPETMEDLAKHKAAGQEVTGWGQGTTDLHGTNGSVITVTRLVTLQSTVVRLEQL